MAEPYVIVKNGANLNEQWDFRGNAACPTIERVWEGDGPVSFSYEFRRGFDRLPPRQAEVEVYTDTDGRIWKGVLLHRDPPELSECAGQCTLRADGDRVRMGWRKFDEPTAYGPVWEGTSLALTPYAMILNAFGQLGSGINQGFNVLPNSGFTELPDTEQFLGRTLRDVSESVASIGAGLATPFVWSVRDGTYRFQNLSAAPTYQVSIAAGAKVKPTDDSTRLYSRVVGIWGNNQVVTYPADDDLIFTQIPNQVDIVVNIGAEVRDEASARTVIRGIYARLQYLELGWSALVTVPGNVKVDSAGGPIDGWNVQAQNWLRIDDLEWADNFGPNHPCPQQLLITGATFDGGANETRIQCGEWRDPTATMRRVTHGEGSRTFFRPDRRAISMPQRDANKLPIIGPQSSTTVTTGPSPIHPGIPQQSAKYNTVLPETLPPQPPIQQFHDGDPTASGVKFKAIVPPLKVASWSALTSGIVSDYAGNWTRRSNGAVVASIDLAGSSEKVDQVVGSTTVLSTIGLVDRNDVLIYTVTTPASSTAVEFVDVGLRCTRYFPDYPQGHQLQNTGTTATAT